ncbi:fatty acid oxidation complex subunit alpha FadB [Paraburkholderia dinghuensis]|uniref:enoyl-CoA hydratase n=1 Tax=Paraburkholderia dinghuensis TaxID=2305225 RepID=A0A3N6MMI3_9BURK|nr:fatty acid oxidation complex subunit alpha FadB [Paraburkholderia dinghuensis]RQH05054.1 fatty acid oxidation complex subunit alpha FadB [Paraburkholderia dinghuensis]
MFKGQSIRVQALGDGYVELCFDREGDSINKLDARTVDELRRATAEIAGVAGLRGVLVTSAKNVFIVGADITEFGEMFKLPVPDLAAHNARSNEVFNAFEDLPVPTVVALNGFALGGGLEMAMSACYRIMSSEAQVGLPEVKLGLFPGFGGTVRLPRLASPAVAIDWIASGKPSKADGALAAGVVDTVAQPEALRDVALDHLKRAAEGKLDWRARQNAKRSPLAQSPQDLAKLFDEARAKVAKSSGKHQPAALSAVEMMERAARMDRAGALDEEGLAFARIAKTQAADALVQTFLSDQVLKKLFKQHAKQARAVGQGAVLGAGIMGGGIAYTSALRGVPVRLKDIAQAQLDLGISEAEKQLAKQIKAGRLAQSKAHDVLRAIVPSLAYTDFDKVDVVVEAVVENLGVKHKVLRELEGVVRSDTVIASNTSSLRIDDIAQPLQRPENFVGMHFFNPVPVMPLVEVIKGSRTSDAAVSTAVGYAVAMGKTPIVVKDCPGFLVNRILTAYMRGFLQLVSDGADFERVDQVMEAFGWPMGPAYLEDVVGMDTGSHVSDIISAGYAERMPYLEHDALRLMSTNKRFGQKNGVGFYRYETDPNGKPRRSVADDTRALLAQIQPNGTRDFSDNEIIERMMLPLIIEAAHALEDGVVASPVELDMALLLGIGFPAYLGGALKYADWLGLAHVVERAEAYAALGPGYRPTERMRAMAAQGQRFYGN